MSTIGREWSILTWNIQGTKPTDLDRLAEVIRRDAPDAITLQEVRRPQADVLATMLDMEMTWAFKHGVLTPLFPGRAEGAAILTPHSLDGADTSVVSRLRWKRTYRRRISQWAVVSRPDGSAYRLFNVHLSPHDRIDDRVTESRHIAAIAAGLGDAPPIVLAGDFNNHGEAEVTDALPGVEHVTPAPTNPSSAPTQQLDHVLLPASARDVSVSVPAGGSAWAELSDHLPVTVRFTLDWVCGDFV